MNVTDPEGNGAATANAVAKTQSPAAKPGPIQFSPETFDDLWRMATVLAKSELLPPALRNNPASIAVVAMTGRDLGLSAMQAIRGIHVVEGRPAFSAGLMQALVRSRDRKNKIEILESTDKIARVRCTRDGEEPYVAQFTIEEARKIGVKYADGKPITFLANKAVWKNYGPDMLLARATARGCRAVWQDALFGCYLPDEIEEIDGDATPPPRSKRGTAMNRTLDDVLTDDEAPPSNGSRAVVVETPTEADTKPEAEAPTAAPDDSAERAALRESITALSLAAPSGEDVEAAYVKAGVSFDVASLDEVPTEGLRNLNRTLTFAVAARKSAPPVAAPKVEPPPESQLARDVRIIGLARSGQAARFREVCERLKLPKGAAASWSPEQRAALILDVFGDLPPA